VPGAGTGETLTLAVIVAVTSASVKATRSARFHERLNHRMTGSGVFLLDVGALPVLFGQHPTASNGAARTRLAVLDIGVVDIPGPLIEGDFFAGFEVASCGERHFVCQPGVRVTGVASQEWLRYSSRLMCGSLLGSAMNVSGSTGQMERMR
jgi:hypothetical protein